jgi:hypothetical protein
VGSGLLFAWGSGLSIDGIVGTSGRSAALRTPAAQRANEADPSAGPVFWSEPVLGVAVDAEPEANGEGDTDERNEVASGDHRYRNDT